MREPDSTCVMIQPGFLDPETSRDLIELAHDGSVPHRLDRLALVLVLLDQGMSGGDVAKVLFLDYGTIRAWYRPYQEDGFDELVSFGYDGSACETPEDQLKAWITETLPRTTGEVGAWVEKEFGASPMTAGLGWSRCCTGQTRDGASQTGSGVEQTGPAEAGRVHPSVRICSSVANTTEQPRNASTLLPRLEPR
jgi:hypothetical protein